MKNIALTVLLTSTLALSACGNTQSERALSGAGIGAAAGALGGAVVGGSVAGGALVGAAVGGAAGGLTDKDTIDLDR